MRNRLLTFASFFTVLVFFSVQDTRGAQVTHTSPGITEEERNVITKIAKNKARALGYKTEELNFELRKEKDFFKAYFYPKQKKGTVTYGGTLTIYLDQKQNILRFERGV
ncbi:MAG: hypothetical protein HYY45_22340 [Deltaproteobacteria bacterium]|nr:hypothetical protein [Deltaproteobacteria bacterium]